jgi:selenophosphate synthetase-related protein
LPHEGARLRALAQRLHTHGGTRAKAALGLVREVLGDTNWIGEPGDDAAALEDGRGYLLLAGEAMSPPLVENDPRAAGVAAVVTNVNDVAAMGGRALALVDHIVGPRAVARRALEGMRDAAELYRVPIVGGHLTVRAGPSFVAASVMGRADHLLSATNVAPGQVLVVGCATEGVMRRDFGFFSSLEARRAEVAGDVGILARLAEEGACAAAKDVSMAGLLGSLAMLLEPTACGAVIDVGLVPLPAGVTIEEWAFAFPSFAFLLCAPSEHAARCVEAFAARRLSAAVVGAVDGTGVIRAHLDEAEEALWDLREGSVTGLAG